MGIKVSRRIRKSCVKCRAFEAHYRCSLGYKNDRGTPKEPCPKPLNIKSLIEAETHGTKIIERENKDE